MFKRIGIYVLSKFFLILFIVKTSSRQTGWYCLQHVCKNLSMDDVEICWVLIAFENVSMTQNKMYTCTAIVNIVVRSKDKTRHQSRLFNVER